MAPTLDGISDIPVLSKSSYSNRESLNRNTAGVWGYIIQILFQVIYTLMILLVFICLVHDIYFNKSVSNFEFLSTTKDSLSSITFV